MLDPRHLRILLTVTRTGSFSAAARELNMSQPAISMLIAQLEDRAGKKLVERGRSGATPTRAGQVLTRRAEMIERVLADAEREIVLGSQDLFGPLTIGGTPGAMMTLVPSAIARLRSQGIRASIKLIQAPDSHLNGMLREFAIDLAICTVGVGCLPADLVEQTIAVDEFVVVMRAAHSFAEPEARLKELTELDWVLPSDGGAFQRQIESMFAEAGATAPPHGVRLGALAIVREIIRCSDYVTIAPAEMMRPDIEAGLLRSIPIASAPRPRAVGLRRLQGRHQTELAQQFISAMVEINATRHQPGL